MKEIYKKIQSLSQRDVADAKGLTLKAMEELGELVQALLHENGYKPNKKPLNEIKENQLEELCDVIICMFGVADKLDFKYIDIVEELEKKSDKWERVLNERTWDNHRQHENMNLRRLYDILEFKNFDDQIKECKTANDFYMLKTHYIYKQEYEQAVICRNHEKKQFNKTKNYERNL